MARSGRLNLRPSSEPSPTGDQQARIVDRAEAQADRDALAAEGLDTMDLDDRIGELDEQITEAGMRGKVLPVKPRRHRSTRRRHDAAHVAVAPGISARSTTSQMPCRAVR